MQAIPRLHKLKFTLLNEADSVKVEARIRGIEDSSIHIAYSDFNPETGVGHLSVYSHMEVFMLIKYLGHKLDAILREMDSCNN